MKTLERDWDKRAKEIKWDDEYRKKILNSGDLLVKFLSEYKKSNLKKKIKLLDAGSGIGQYVYDAKRLGFDAVGLDFSKEAVKKAKELGNKVVFGDMRKMPFKNGRFDIVLAGGSIEHFPETENAIREINRVLKNGGALIGNVPHRYGLYTLSKLGQQALGIWKCGYEKSFSIPHFKNLLEKNGFKDIRIKRQRIIIGRKKILSGLLKIFDEPLYLIGLGGAHFYFFAKKA